MIRQKFLIMGLLFVLSAAVIVTAAESNNVDVSSKDKGISTQAKIGNSQEDDKNKNEKKKEDYIVENQVLKYAVKSYQESIVTLRWAIGGIITLISILAVAVGYVVIRYSREYKEAVNEAREASKDASRYAEKAEEKLAEIDKKVKDKLEEIESKGKTQIEALIKEAEKRREESRKEAERQREESRKEAEKQRKISELLREGSRAFDNKDYESAANKSKQIVEDFKEEDAAAYNNWGSALVESARRQKDDEAERLFAEAIAKYEKAVTIKPDFHEAYYGWGTALSGLARRKKGDEAEKLFAEAFGKYEKAVAIKPDFNEAYYGWGIALLDLAKRKEGEEQRALLEGAKEKYLKAESIKRGVSAYKLACANCLLGDEEECKRWLKIGEEEGTLLTRERAMKDNDLESVRNKAWFKGIRWKGE